MSAPYYAAAGIELWLGDCLEQSAWLAADVLVTDPPYGTGWSQGAFAPAKGGASHRSAPTRAHGGICNDGDTQVRDSALALWAPRPWLLFGSWRAAFPKDHSQVLVWRKPSSAGLLGSLYGLRKDTELMFMGGDWPRRSAHRSSLFTTGGNHVQYHAGHPHSKPVPLMMELLACCPDGTVADPFTGAGATLLAAKALGRKAIGVEIMEAYCEKAALRLEAQQ